MNVEYRDGTRERLIGSMDELLQRASEINGERGGEIKQIKIKRLPDPAPRKKKGIMVGGRKR